MRSALAVLALALALAACGDETGPATTATPATSGTVPATPGTVPATPGTPVPTEVPTGGEEIVATAVSDLAARLDVNESSIELVSFEWVTWNDGSLGCPQPGMMYTQALVEGSRTILAHEGDRFSYHAGSDGEPFLCENAVVDGKGTVSVPGSPEG